MTEKDGKGIVSNIGHTGIVVRDLDKAIAFYRDVLGLELLNRDERHGEYINTLVGLEGVSLEFANLGIKSQPYSAVELLQYTEFDTTSTPRNSNSLGCNHIQFFVEDIDEAYRDLKERGIQFNSPPLMVPTGTKKSIYLRDPDGNILEFHQNLT